MQEAGTITQALFVEGRELAYCCSADLRGFEDFAAGVVGEMFRRYPSVFFEADDCDPVAMKLLAMFQIPVQNACHTYIREKAE